MKPGRRSKLVTSAVGLGALGLCAGVALWAPFEGTRSPAAVSAPSDATVEVSVRMGNTVTKTPDVTTPVGTETPRRPLPTPSLETAHTPRSTRFTKDVPFGARPPGEVAYRLLANDPALMATQKLHRALVKLPGLHAGARPYLADKHVLEGWMGLLAAPPEAANESDILKRAFVIDGLQEAASWTQNPMRTHVLSAVLGLLVRPPPADANEAQLRVLAAERIELWRIAKRHFSDHERGEVSKERVQSAWTLALNERRKEN